MLAKIPTTRITQRRYSPEGGVIQQVPPIWANVWASHTGSQVSFEYHHPGGVDTGLANPTLPQCHSVVSLSVPTHTWEAQFPVGFVGSPEELLLSIQRLPQHPYLVFLSDTAAQVQSFVQRRSVQVDALLFVPFMLSIPAVKQSSIGAELYAHLLEALDAAGAEVVSSTELPQFSQRVRDQLQLPAELYVVRMRVAFPETAKTTKRYELQV